MASVFGVNNIMDTQIYDKIKVYEGLGNIGFCGWGVRDRGVALPSGRSVLCQNWPAREGSSISWLRFRVSAYAGGSADIVFSFWQKGPGAITYTRVGYVTITEADIDMSPGEYTFALDTPISFSSVSGTTCLMAIYTSANVQLDYTDDTGSNDARSYIGDASASATFDWDAGAGVSDRPFAVSAEAFDSPTDWDQVLDGGCIGAESTAWQDVHFCTSTTWTNPENIYDGNPATAAVSTSGNGAAIHIDLGAGLVPDTPWARLNVFPDYTAYGVRAVFRMHIDGIIDIGGGIAVSYSDSDEITVPVGGWETVYWNDNSGGVDDDITIPVIARWIKITEVGTSVLDEISEFSVRIMTARVTDGNFWVEPAEDPNLVWVESYVTEAKAYVMSIGNVARAESPTSYPVTNRRYRD